MVAAGKVTRDMVLDSLSSHLEPLTYVRAVWEGGAIGHGRLDEWSDIDLYVLVPEGCVEDAFAAVENALASISPIAVKYDIGKTPHPGVHQAFYRLERASEFLLLDVAVVTEGAPDKFLEPETHGEPSFLFRKGDAIEVPPLDRAKLREDVRGRIGRLRLRMDVFHVFVQKELNRGHLIEAVDAYHVVVLASLTEMLRIRHHPVHHGFQTRYIYSELPPEAVSRLEDLFLVADAADLARKYSQARRWFDELYDEIASIGADRLVPL